MPKELIDLSLKTKIILAGISFVFAGGVTYALILNNAKGVSKNQEAAKEDRAKAESNVKAVDVKLEAHKEKNIETEKEQAKKHEEMKDNLHQYEIIVQRQLAVSEALAKGQVEAKQERKDDRAVILKMSEAVIKIQSQVENLERVD